MTGQLHVSGGAGGIRANVDDLVETSSMLAAMACTLGAVTVRVGGVAADPVLLGSVLVSPVTAVVAEDALVAALVGRHGLARRVTVTAGVAAALGAAAAVYAQVEAALTTGLHDLDQAVGQALGPQALALLPVGLLADACGLPAGDRWLESAVGVGAAGLVSWRPGPVVGPTRDPGAAAAALAGALRPAGLLLDGSAVRVGVGRPVAVPAPATLVDLFGTLDGLYPGRGGSAQESTVRVTAVVHGGPAGPRRAWVVSVPGTQTFDPVAGPDAFDLTSDVTTLAGGSGAAAAAVVAAMQAAGVPRGEPVLLTGHSLGGMVAAALAAQPAFRSRWDVTHVVVAGAPVALTPVPDDVAVLSIEHTDDLVPLLDGVPDPDRPNWVTVRRRWSPATLSDPLAAHDSGAYARTAAAVDADPDPSLRLWLAGLRPFLAGPDGATAVAVDVHAERASSG